jgi:hypothetical protein
MKFTAVATVAAFAVAAEAARQGPRAKFVRCQVSGDPHYTPFTGKSNKFTMMGQGEFVLAKDGDFQVNGCQADQNWNAANTAAGDKTRTFKNVKGALTWNKEVVAKEGDNTVEVIMEPTTKVIVNGKSINFDVTGSWKQNRVSVKDVAGLYVRQDRRNRLVIKFTETGRMLVVSHMSKSSGRFGTRKAFNVVIKAPKTATYTGLCAEKKTTKSNWATSAVGAGTSLFTGSETCTAAVVAEVVKEEDAVVVADITKLPCQRLVRAAALSCQATGAADQDGCIFDIAAGCTATDELPTTPEAKKEVLEVIEETTKEFVEQAEIVKGYSCPVNAYVSTKSWPLAGFHDCKCLWGYSAVEDTSPNPEWSCVKNAAATAKQGSFDRSTYGGEQCFCDPNSAFHCSHRAVGDRSCGLPLKIGGQADEVCNGVGGDLDAMDSSKCVCGEGTMDCRNSKYELVAVRQPSLAVPDQPFGQQPIFELRNNGKIEATDSSTMVRISIANVQTDKCACVNDTPCKHNGIANDSCYAKHELFGESVCPAGTTECLPEQAGTKLYRNDLENPAVKLKDQQCRNGVIDIKNGAFQPTRETLTGFCSGDIPCKHQNDGTCSQMVAFSPLEEQLPVAAKQVEVKCRGTADWRLAEPSASPGWFFATDATCDMTDASKGCTDDTHSYAMDKWCDHNCNPKFVGQPPFCPPSHCTCKADDVVPKAAQQTAGWACPLDRYADGSCRCSAGTERCGSIEVKAHKGVFSFEHLTVGKAGKYQLLVEVIMPDQNTGSNNMQVSALTQTFEVRYASKAAGECRAQKAWRVDDLPNSEVQGAGKAWFYADASVKCTAKNPDGTCKETKKVYAMDKWCKANRCLPHTLGSHCEIAAPTALRQVACAVTDTFGECCQSGVVDQCGVCDGDGSTCKIETYRSAFVADTATTDLVFDAAHAGHDCPTHSPCAHKNTGDKSCVPKTFNSAKKVNEDFEYCYKNMVGDNSHWKKGEWDDANGQMSIASGLHADGNTDCFCPVGTVDVTDRAIVGETAIDDFKVEFKKKIADIKQQVADKLIEATVETEMLAKDIMLQNTEGGIELWSSKCADAKIGQGKKITLTDAKFAPTGGMAWDTNTAKKGDEEVGCVRVPPLVTVSTYKVGCKKDVPDQKKYKTFVNMKTTVEWFSPESDEAKLFGGIEANGDVLKPTAEIVGTEADAAEMACSASPGSLTCSKDSACKQSMEAVKTCTKEGSNTLTCTMRNSFSGAKHLTTAWASLARCMAKSVATKGLFGVFSKGLFGGKKRRLASGVTAAVRITTGGNNGLIGTPSSTASAQVPAASTAPGKFGAGGTSYNANPAATSGSSGAAMTALIALVSVGAVVGAAVAVKKRQSGAAPTAFTPSRSNELASTGANKDDCTDVL